MYKDLYALRRESIKA